MAARTILVTLAAVLLASLALLRPAAADAGGGFAPCSSDSDFKCMTLTVPLDHSGSVAGELDLRVEKLPTRKRRAGTIVFLAGGPGESATAAASFVSILLESAAPRHDLVFFDQRGTGRSSASTCTALSEAAGSIFLADLSARAEACAAELGVFGSFLRTADSVEDLEAVRQAIGAETIAIVGVSYGTVVAQAYARAYPERVSHLVLDSVVDPTRNSLLALDAHDAVKRVLRSLCARKACAGITRDPYGDYLELARIVASDGLTGTAVDSNGRRTPRTLGGPSNPLALFDLLVTSDLQVDLMARFPSAMRSALAGDPAPLLRIDATADAGPHPRPEEISVATLAATSCSDARFPWTSAMAVDSRPAATSAAIATIEPSRYAPYAPEELARSTSAMLCSRWPSVAEAPSDGDLPNVPALLLAGKLDLRTPAENARRIARQLPQSTLVEVPAAGHSILGSHLSGIIELQCFFKATGVGNTCERSLGDLLGAVLSQAAVYPPIAPTRLGSLKPATGVGGRRGRTITALRATLTDATTSLPLARAGRTPTVPGLRRGKLAVRVVRRGLKLRLASFSYLPGVDISGVVTILDDGTITSKRLRVRGTRGSKGWLRIQRDGSINGVLDGRPVRSPGDPRTP